MCTWNKKHPGPPAVSLVSGPRALEQGRAWPLRWVKSSSGTVLLGWLPCHTVPRWRDSGDLHEHLVWAKLEGETGNKYCSCSKVFRDCWCGCTPQLQVAAASSGRCGRGAVFQRSPRPCLALSGATALPTLPGEELKKQLPARLGARICSPESLVILELLVGVGAVQQRPETGRGARSSEGQDRASCPQQQLQEPAGMELATAPWAF